MAFRHPPIALALVLPASASAAPYYSKVIASAQHNPAQAASLWDAFCKGPTPTLDWVCDAIKAAEKPIRDDEGMSLTIAQ